MNENGFPLHNVLLDYLNRDDRVIAGLFDNYSIDAHATLLAETLNLAVFLCDEYCITSPGPIAECTIAQSALSGRRDFLKQRLIRLPLRENNIDDFLEKKQRQYGSHPDVYRQLLHSRSARFFFKFSN